MLILFSSDLHGNKFLYENLISSCKEYNPDLVLLGGDLLPKLEHSNKIFSIQKNFAQKDLPEFMSRIKLASDSNVGIMLGNDDFSILKNVLLPFQHDEILTLIDNKLWDTGLGWDVMGFNLVPETPFCLKDLERRDELKTEIKDFTSNGIVSTLNGFTSINARCWFESHSSIAEELSRLPKVTRPNKTIFVSHSPPYNTPLDMLFDETHVGSKAIKNYIKTVQPAICFHGHIHESVCVSKKYHTSLGCSICFNPGQIHIPSLDAVLVDTESQCGTHKHTHGISKPSETGILFLNPPLHKQ
ncbi:MAG: hypothetical protein D3925_00260 [Candidatus Electrothrix sp. AR5]|nr:hypothetical protein [Candidatus Electrothrix sp. AR5]